MRDAQTKWIKNFASSSVRLVGRKKERWLWTTNQSEATAGVGREAGLVEGHFAQDAGQVPAKFVVVPEAAQMKHNAVDPGQLCFQIVSAVIRFHVQFLRRLVLF